MTAEDEMRETAKLRETRAIPAMRESETTLSAGSALPTWTRSRRVYYAAVLGLDETASERVRLAAELHGVGKASARPLASTHLSSSGH